MKVNIINEVDIENSEIEKVKLIKNGERIIKVRYENKK